jgi:hypothetical protein
LALTGNAQGAGALVDQPYAVAYGDRLTTEAYLDGQGPFTLLIDTASSQSVLFAHTASRLGLSPTGGPQITVHGIVDETQSAPFLVTELRLGEERIANVTVAVLADPAHKDEEPDGVLGIDVLEHYFVAFDHRDRHLRLYERAAEAPTAYAQWPFVPMRPRRLKGLHVDFWFIDARYEGRPADTLIDLGTGVTILTWSLASRLVRRDQMPSKKSDEVRDALGKGVPAFRLEGLRIEFAGRTWTGRIALVVDAPIFRLLELGDRPTGIIGPGLLKDDSFALDFERRRLYVGPREAPAERPRPQH